MNTTRSGLVVCALLIGLSGCDRIRSSLRPGDEGGTSASASDNTLPSLTGFEGEIDLVTKSAKSPTGPTPLNLLVKSERVRVDLPPGTQGLEQMGGGGKVYGVLNIPEKKALLVMDAKKQALVIDLNKTGDTLKTFKGPSAPSGPSGPPQPPPKVTKTGHKDLVAGYTCEDWSIEPADGKSKTMVCVAEQSSFFHLPLTGLPTEHLWMLELMDGKHFPLRGIAYENGAETGRVEVTKIDKKSLDNTLFEVPAGYQTVDIEQMFAGLGGPGGPGHPGLPPGAGGPFGGGRLPPRPPAHK